MQTESTREQGDIGEISADVDIGHCCLGLQVPIESEKSRVLEELSYHEIEMAYMFNYQDHRAVGKKRVLIQLDDSEWSQPYPSSQSAQLQCSIEHPERGLLEVGFKIKAGPGRLAKYTKIVRFMPRIIVTNKLTTHLRLLQPAGFQGETEAWVNSAMIVLPTHSAPVHFPNPYADKALSLQHSGSYQRTVFFGIENIGTHTVRVDHKLDMASIPHVNTRDALEYTVKFPNDKEIGIWFETDWSGDNIVVSDGGVKKGCYAYNETDIQERDVLLTVDGRAARGKDFDEIMKLLQNRTGTISVTLRTNEENIRLVREAAMKKGNNKYSTVGDSTSGHCHHAFCYQCHFIYGDPLVAFLLYLYQAVIASNLIPSKTSFTMTCTHEGI